MPINWARFAEIVRSHQRFVLVSHIRPDCDALGSELGMAAILESLGKTVRIVNGQATPPSGSEKSGDAKDTDETGQPELGSPSNARQTSTDRHA